MFIALHYEWVDDVRVEMHNPYGWVSPMKTDVFS